MIWTEVPNYLKVLASQRDRWHRGLADALWRNRRVLVNHRYGAMRMVVYPYSFFVELLAPIVEVLGLVATIAGLSMGAINLHFAMLFLLVAYGYGLALTTFTLVSKKPATCATKNLETGCGSCSGSCWRTLVSGS